MLLQQHTAYKHQPMLMHNYASAWVEVFSWPCVGMLAPTAVHPCSCLHLLVRTAVQCEGYLGYLWYPISANFKCALLRHAGQTKITLKALYAYKLSYCAVRGPQELGGPFAARGPTTDF
jgi:hypothetical protein